MNCYLFYSRPRCFDKGVKRGKRGMKYHAMKVRNEEPSPLSLSIFRLHSYCPGFQGVPLRFDLLYPLTRCARLQHFGKDKSIPFVESVSGQLLAT